MRWWQRRYRLRWPVTREQPGPQPGERLFFLDGGRVYQGIVADGQPGVFWASGTIYITLWVADPKDESWAWTMVPLGDLRRVATIWSGEGVRM